MSEGFTLLPAKSGTCPTCATKHEQHEPHNQQSLFYQYRFYSQRGRWPTWKDAIEHCPEDIKRVTEDYLRSIGKWSEPSSEVPDVLPTPHHTIGTVTTVDMAKPKRKRKAKR